MNEIESTKTETTENAILDGQDFDAQSEPEQVAEQSDAPYMTFNYNHEKIELGREDATEWAQKGMHYFNKLDFVASMNNTTVDSMLKEMVADIDRQKRLSLQEKFGDDSAIVDDLMTLFHNQNKEKYEKAKIERAQTKEALALSRSENLDSDFAELQKDFPELKSLEDIPQGVIAAADEMPLMVAYLLYRHREDQKIKAAQTWAEQTAAASTGSVASNTPNTAHSADEAFMKAFWR